MKEYLTKYPEEFQDIGALLYSLGEEETDKICNEAIANGKKIQVENSADDLDLISYQFY